jgi:hypothetical protein
MRAAAGGFEVFVTADQNLSYQQNLSTAPLAVVVLVAQSNAIEDLAPLVPALLHAVRDVRPGELCRIGTP